MSEQASGEHLLVNGQSQLKYQSWLLCFGASTGVLRATACPILQGGLVAFSTSSVQHSSDLCSVMNVGPGLVADRAHGAARTFDAHWRLMNGLMELMSAG